MALWKPIPGETPIDDLSGLKIEGIRLRSELNRAEAENILKAATKYFIGKLKKSDAPFDHAWALQLHREMFGDVWAWGGVLRTDARNIGVPAPQIEGRLYELMERLPYWKDEPWVKQAAMLHHEAVAIHPFPNGNGRWSRMLANIWMRRNDVPYTQWPEETVGEVSVIRKEYIAAIKAADDGDYEPLVELHRRFTPEVLG